MVRWRYVCLAVSYEFGFGVQLLQVVNQHLVGYPTPINLNWSWNWGSLAGVLLMSQMVTGILLAMHYVPHVHFAFATVQHLMTDVPSGWAMQNLVILAGSHLSLALNLFLAYLSLFGFHASFDLI